MYQPKFSSKNSKDTKFWLPKSKTQGFPGTKSRVWDAKLAKYFVNISNKR